MVPGYEALMNQRRYAVGNDPLTCPVLTGCASCNCDCRPCVAIFAYALSKYPGADLDVSTGIGQRFPGNTYLPKSWFPRGVDLHKTEIVASVGVVIDSGGVEVALTLGDGSEELGRDAVHGSRLLITEGVRRAIGTDNCSQ